MYLTISLYLVHVTFSWTEEETDVQFVNKK